MAEGKMTGGEGEEMERLVTVFASLDPMQAELAASLLRSTGISVFVSHSYINRTASLWLAGFPVQVMVPASVAEEAREILRQGLKPRFTPLHPLPRLTEVSKPAPQKEKRTLIRHLVILLVSFLILLYFCSAALSCPTS